jgi:hypothetical protein
MELYKHDVVELFQAFITFKMKAYHRYYVQCQANPKNETVAFVDITLSSWPLEHEIWATVSHKPSEEVELSTFTLENRGTECVEDPNLTVSHDVN